MNVRLNLRDDSVEFGAIHEVVPMGLTEKGHYAIPMFEFNRHECCKKPIMEREKKEKNTTLPKLKKKMSHTAIPSSSPK